MKCADCQRELQIGDFPFCRGSQEDHVGSTSRSGEWGDKDAVVVFRKPDGSLSYPARNDKRTPDGCERIVIKSLREMNRFERQHNVVNHAMHYDSNGRGHDDYIRNDKVTH